MQPAVLPLTEDALKLLLIQNGQVRRRPGPSARPRPGAAPRRPVVGRAASRPGGRARVPAQMWRAAWPRGAADARGRAGGRLCVQAYLAQPAAPSRASYALYASAPPPPPPSPASTTAATNSPRPAPPHRTLQAKQAVRARRGLRVLQLRERACVHACMCVRACVRACVAPGRTGTAPPRRSHRRASAGGKRRTSRTTTGASRWEPWAGPTPPSGSLPWVHPSKWEPTLGWAHPPPSRARRPHRAGRAPLHACERGRGRQGCSSGAQGGLNWRPHCLLHSKRCLRQADLEAEEARREQQRLEQELHNRVRRLPLARTARSRRKARHAASPRAVRGAYAALLAPSLQRLGDRIRRTGHRQHARTRARTGLGLGLSLLFCFSQRTEAAGPVPCRPIRSHR